MNLSIPLALLAGLVTFFSPCVIPMIPGYLAVLTGGKRNLAVRRAVFFSLGLGLTFSAVGILAGLAGGVITPVKDVLMRLIGLALVIYGINLVRPWPWGFFSKEWRIAVDSSESTDLKALGLGAVFGVAWVPCAGIILGAILAQAILFQSGNAAFLLLSYSLGLIAPMIVLAFIYERSGTVLRVSARVSHLLSIGTGFVITIFGLALLLGLVGGWQSFLLNLFPDWEKITSLFTQ